MPNPLMEPYFEAQEDLSSDAPMSAKIRMQLAEDALFLAGLSRNDIDQLIKDAQEEFKQMKTELETV